MRKHCARCDAAFECDPGPDCWSTKLPPAMPVSSEGCFCPRCLGEQIDAKVAARGASGQSVNSSKS